MGVKFFASTFILIYAGISFHQDRAVADAEVAISNNDAIETQMLKAVVKMIEDLDGRAKDSNELSVDKLDFGKLGTEKAIEGKTHNKENQKEEAVLRKVIEGIEQEADSLAVQLGKYTWTVLGHELDNPNDEDYAAAKRVLFCEFARVTQRLFAPDMTEWAIGRHAKLNQLKRQLEKKEREESKHGVGIRDERQKKGSDMVDDLERILTYCDNSTSALNDHLKVATKKDDGYGDNRLVVVSSYHLGVSNLKELLLRLDRIDPQADTKQLEAVLSRPTSYFPVDALIAGVCRKAEQLDAAYHDNDGKFIKQGKVKNMPKGKRRIIVYVQLVKVALGIVDGYWGTQEYYKKVLEKHVEAIEKLRNALVAGKEEGQYGQHTFAECKEQTGEDEGDNKDEEEFHTLADLSAERVAITDITGYVDEQVTINTVFDQSNNHQVPAEPSSEKHGNNTPSTTATAAQNASEAIAPPASSNPTHSILQSTKEAEKKGGSVLGWVRSAFKGLFGESKKLSKKTKGGAQPEENGRG